MINEIIAQIGGRERLELAARCKGYEASVFYPRAGQIELMARALLMVLDAQKEPVAFYANNAYYNTERAALKDGAQSVMPLYTFPPEANVPEITKVAKAMREWIDAIPKDVVASLPAMPGFDRDWADEIISTAKAEKTEKPIVLQGGRLKPDGKFWYDEDTISNILYQAGIEVKK